MLLLTSTTSKIQVTTGSAASVDVHASLVDYATGVTTPSTQNTANIATATTADVVNSPAASTQRNVKRLNIRNKHASNSTTIVVTHTDGTTAVELFKATLAPGEQMHFIDGEGVTVFDATGAQKVVATSTGRLLLRTPLTAGTSFTTTTQTNSIKVFLLGGGGAGGGCTVGSASISGGAGGGGAGGYAEKTFAVSPNTAYTYAIGAAGAAGATGANAGGNGGNTTFAVGATTVTAFGGTGGLPCTSAATVVTLGGAGGVISTNGDVNGSGAPGLFGLVISVGNALSGSGGSTDYGGGGNSLKTQGTGNNAVGKGSGGGGGCTISTTGAVAGGGGGGGMIIVEEYA
jgi:hypothetical protein